MALVAAWETANALLAPLLAPSAADWRNAAAEVRANFRPGDLVVAAPFWSDPVMRVHLGDLTPPPVAGRLDAERFGRIWEVGQRGAHAAEAAGAREVSRRRHGALTVRLYEKPAAAVTYDFVERAGEAHVSSGGAVAPQIVEVDGRLRRAVLARPVPGGALLIEYPAVPLGRVLAVGSGLHNVWSRRAADGIVVVRVLIDGRPLVTTTAGNETGWTVTRVDTAVLAGRMAPVTFEIRSDRPQARDFAFAAEARN